ncbi:MAG: winged helix-turn-helix transcriptional regulator [Firmicutes bacterium]|nr:winged helix-turn-helix transcriptional regulator [Bacillota bacterium]
MIYVHSLNERTDRMWFDLGDYLQPTPLLNELRLLARLSEHPGSSQAELGRIIGLAPAMVNTYLRRFAEAGLIDRLPHEGRGVDYRLTPAGDRRRSYHVITFLAQLYALFDQVLDDLRERVIHACGEEPTRLIIYGAGETGRMTYLAIQGLPHITVVGVMDDDPAKLGMSFFTHHVEGPQVITDLHPDKILITSWRHSEAMLRKIAPVAAEHSIEIARLIP